MGNESVAGVAGDMGGAMREARPVRAVLFDMDGVLVDSEDLIAAAAMRLFRERYGTEVRREDFHPFVGAGETRYVGGVAEKYGIEVDIVEAKEILYRNYEELAVAGMEILPGAREYPFACRKAGLKIALASAADRVKVLVNLRALDLGEDFFDALVTGGDVERKKPYPDIYLEAARRIAVDPAECVVVEDAVNGVIAGKAAGARCLGLTTSFSEATLREAGAAWIAPHLGAAPLPSELL